MAASVFHQTITALHFDSTYVTQRARQRQVSALRQHEWIAAQSGVTRWVGGRCTLTPVVDRISKNVIRLEGDGRERGARDRVCEGTPRHPLQCS
jgi:hypothetical protein